MAKEYLKDFNAPQPALELVNTTLAVDARKK